MTTLQEKNGLTPEQKQLMQKLYERVFNHVSYEEISITLNNCLTEALQTEAFDDTRTRTNTVYIFDIVHTAFSIIQNQQNPEHYKHVAHIKEQV